MANFVTLLGVMGMVPQASISIIKDNLYNVKSFLKDYPLFFKIIFDLIKTTIDKMPKLYYTGCKR